MHSLPLNIFWKTSHICKSYHNYCIEKMIQFSNVVITKYKFIVWVVKRIINFVFKERNNFFYGNWKVACFANLPSSEYHNKGQKYMENYYTSQRNLRNILIEKHFTAVEIFFRKEKDLNFFISFPIIHWNFSDL